MTRSAVVALGLTLTGLVLTQAAPAAQRPPRLSLDGPASASPRTPVGFKLTVRNRGTSSLRGLRAEVLLSRDRRRDGRDRTLARISLPAIRRGRSVTRTLRGRIPRGTPSGRRFVLACVRPRGGERPQCVERELPIQQPNVLLVIADDMGAFDANVYGAAVGTADPAVTPVIDRLASRGVTFNRAWSNPVCSPTRASVYTGRYSLATGVGSAVDDLSPLPGGLNELRAGERTLPDYLEPLGYRSGLFGKWHLGLQSPSGHDSPRDIGGFDFHSGRTLGEFRSGEGYTSWERWVNGRSQGTDTTYITTRNVDDAVRWIRSGGEPWMATVAFSAPHSPFHVPPASLLSASTNAGLAGVACNSADDRICFKAAIEAMDTEIGRLLRQAGVDAENTLVVFMGDNGTPTDVAVPGLFPAGRDKGTVYEGGVRVPMIVAGPPVVAPGTIDHPVNTTDVFDTIADAVGGPATNTPAATSTVPYLQDLAAPFQRDYVYSEYFQGGVGVHAAADPDHQAAIFDGRFKVVEELAPVTGTYGLSHCYDLTVDPFEANDLWNPTTGQPAECQALYTIMETELH